MHDVLVYAEEFKPSVHFLSLEMLNYVEPLPWKTIENVKRLKLLTTVGENREFPEIWFYDGMGSRFFVGFGESLELSFSREHGGMLVSSFLIT